MTEQNHIPTDIRLHQQRRVLELAYPDGAVFELPCEYLRVHSPSVEVSGLGELVSGRERVNITEIIPIGRYAIRLFFDDGHKSGVYSWETLHDLAVNRERNWAEYLARLEAEGITRKA